MPGRAHGSISTDVWGGDGNFRHCQIHIRNVVQYSHSFVADPSLQNVHPNGPRGWSEASSSDGPVGFASVRWRHAASSVTGPSLVCGSDQAEGASKDCPATTPRV